MRFNKYIFCLLLLYTYTSKGQQLLFENISKQLGLPAQESYNVMQDSKGYIWISTEAGLCKYNGSYCKIFNKKNGLPENSCYAVSEDPNGGLWILTSGNYVLQYVNDTLKKATFSESFFKQLKSTLEQAYSLNFKDDSVIINTRRGTYISGFNSKSSKLVLPDTNSGYYFIKDKTNLYAVKSITNTILLNKLAAKGAITVGINTDKGIKQLSINYKSKNQPKWRVLNAYNKQDSYFIAFDNLLVKLNNDFSYTVYELPNEILSLYCDKDYGLWIGTLKGGVFYYANSNLMREKTINLEGLTVTGICVDKENGVWCTTLEKGVFYCRNKNVISFANHKGLDKPADLLKYVGGKVFASGEDNELIQLGKETISRHELTLMGNKTVSDILKIEKGWMISGKTILLKTNDDFENAVYIKNEGNNFYAGANELTVTEDGRVFGINYGEILEIAKDKAIHRKIPLETGGRCLQQINPSYLLYGCKNGLWSLGPLSSSPQNEEGIEHLFVSKRINGIEGTVTKIFKSSAGELWVATKENGLFIYKNDSLHNMTSALKLPTERFFDITEDPFGTIWLGSGVGLLSLSPSPIVRKEEAVPYKVKIYNTLNGLPSNEIYKVAADSNFIYMSTTEGISRFNVKSDLANEIPPSIYLSSLKINDIIFNYTKPMQLAYNNNSLKIEFDANTFKETGTPTLFYTFNGYNNKIIKKETVKGNSISLDNLSADVYELKVFAVNNDGVLSIKPIVLKFEIQKPYWQSAWFIVLSFIIFSLIVFVIIRQVIKRIKRKEEEKTRINKQLAEFQLTALQAQMNPHFIFNAINSIQTYILENEAQVAYDYLAKFSRLVRLVLNNAKEKSLTLEKELEVLNTYIELEQMRFENKFEFELILDDKLDTYTIQVPPMLLQPYIENAIWHGLMPLKKLRKGKLKLEIKVADNLLQITIEDNGIGRERSIEIKKTKEHKSIGMELTQERMDVLSNMPEYRNAKILVSDLHNENGEASGTRIEIFLPTN